MNCILSPHDTGMLKSRVFVGNLNTVQMSKQILEHIFQNYGPTCGISMHKGYAFIQFLTEADARRAVAEEDGKIYYNMKIDVNIASEPKAIRNRFPQSHSSSSSHNSTSSFPAHFSNTNAKSSFASTTQLNTQKSHHHHNTHHHNNANFHHQQQQQQLQQINAISLNAINSKSIINEEAAPPSSKRFCADSSNAGNVAAGFTPAYNKRNLVSLVKPNPEHAGGNPPHSSPHFQNAQPSSPQQQQTTTNTSNFEENKDAFLYGNTLNDVNDVLICGKCKQIFSNLVQLAKHKKEFCRGNAPSASCNCPTDHGPSLLVCAYCEARFSSAWNLIVHCDRVHTLVIYSLPTADTQDIQRMIDSDANNENKQNADEKNVLEERERTKTSVENHRTEEHSEVDANEDRFGRESGEEENTKNTQKERVSRAGRENLELKEQQEESREKDLLAECTPVEVQVNLEEDEENDEQEQEEMLEVMQEQHHNQEEHQLENVSNELDEEQGAVGEELRKEDEEELNNDDQLEDNESQNDDIMI